MEWFDILSLCACVLACIIHAVIDFIVSRRNGKKIDKLCKKCGLPIYDDMSHSCPLSDDQLSALYDFVVSLRGKNNNDHD